MHRDDNHVFRKVRLGSNRSIQRALSREKLAQKCRALRLGFRLLIWLRAKSRQNTIRSLHFSTPFQLWPLSFSGIWKSLKNVQEKNSKTDPMPFSSLQWFPWFLVPKSVNYRWKFETKSFSCRWTRSLQAPELFCFIDDREFLSLVVFEIVDDGTNAIRNSYEHFGFTVLCQVSVFNYEFGKVPRWNNIDVAKFATLNNYQSRI